MTFDPYHKWLGIAPKDQPPNHYRLLAIEVFESDPEVIDAAANRQMSYLQQRAHGKHAALSQKLLNEIAAARVCLLDQVKKAAYDAGLRASLPTPSPGTPAGIQDVLAEGRDRLFHRAQQSYDEGHFQAVVNLLQGHTTDDARLTDLLTRAKLAIPEVKRLTRALAAARMRGDAGRVKEIASQLLAYQPSHPEATESLRWAELRSEAVTSATPPQGSWKPKDEPFLRKYLAKAIVLFLVGFSLTSALVYYELHRTETTSQQVANAIPTTEAQPLGPDLPQTPTPSRTSKPVEPPAPLPSILLSVSDPSEWTSDKPIKELVEYDKANECARFLETATIHNLQLAKYEPYIITLQFRRSTQSAWGCFWLEPKWTIGLAALGGTGAIRLGIDPKVTPLAGQKVVNGDTNRWKATYVVPMEQAERTTGQWNDIRLERDSDQWTLTINGRIVQKFSASLSKFTPFSIYGTVGFEFRNVEVAPLPEPKQTPQSPTSGESSKPSPSLPSVRFSVSDLTEWRPGAPISELIEYDKTNDCARFLGLADLHNHQLAKYDRYIIKFQFRRTRLAWGYFWLEIDWRIALGCSGGTGAIHVCSGTKVKPLAGQKVVSGDTYPNKLTHVLPMEQTERELGQWNEVRLERELDHWTLAVNGRIVQKFNASAPQFTPFSIHGNAGFEFRSIEVTPLTEVKQTPPGDPGARGIVTGNDGFGKASSGWTFVLMGNQPSDPTPDTAFTVSNNGSLLDCPAGGGWFLATNRTFGEMLFAIEYQYPVGSTQDMDSAVIVATANPADGLTWSNDHSRRRPSPGIEIKLGRNCGQMTLPREDFRVELPKGQMRDGRKVVPIQTRDLSPGTWNKLEVECDGRKNVLVRLNGELVNEIANAERISGRISLWTMGRQVKLRNPTVTIDGKEEKLVFNVTGVIKPER